ncbi:hypothetical protein DS745_12315 [Anaerobacillus alkaliphilus]|uniref:Uncharacterized protein n=1 Tax=Anaerobacillus alkaliphilus TaxID=1548597 RepID=A0A4Q0VRU1_9BACI|nr:hypothetical protein [Anaerobacillus alkaliphilus]RXJ00310.1 hypothetical protein DS745_12315 [Anaerobacillus alkaliphilus]
MRVFLCVLVLALLQPHLVFAHRMVVEMNEPGTIQVRYDDGTNSAIALVKAFDEKGNLLFEETANDLGIVHFDSSIAIHHIIADDGIGHRASWVLEEKVNLLNAVPIWLRALLGISMLLFISALFYYRLN